MQQGKQVPAPLKDYQTTLKQVVDKAGEELKRPVLGLLISGLLAGFALGVSLLLTVLVLGAGDEPHDLAMRFWLANCYAAGFVVVVLANSDLFTEYTTIAVLPILTGDAPVSRLGRLWGVIFGANLAGGALFALVVVTIIPAMHPIPASVFGQIAGRVVEASFWVMLLSATLAGWLMGMLAWLVTAARETISQIILVWLVALIIGAGHLHHCILGAIEVFAGLFSGQPITMGDAGRFLFCATLGNILGALVFALMIRFSVLIGGQDGEHGERR